eukprot:SAG22_NODE_104_length_20159_cov_5.877517_26_plen_215_part_00
MTRTGFANIFNPYGYTNSVTPQHPNDDHDKSERPGNVHMILAWSTDARRWKVRECSTMPCICMMHHDVVRPRESCTHIHCLAFVLLRACVNAVRRAQPTVHPSQPNGGRVGLLRDIFGKAVADGYPRIPRPLGNDDATLLRWVQRQILWAAGVLARPSRGHERLLGRYLRPSSHTRISASVLLVALPFGLLVWTETMTLYLNFSRRLLGSWVKR